MQLFLETEDCPLSQYSHLKESVMRRIGRWFGRLFRRGWEWIERIVENFGEHKFWIGVVIGALVFPIIRGIIRLIFAVPGWFLTLCPFSIILVTAVAVVAWRSRR